MRELSFYMRLTALAVFTTLMFFTVTSCNLDNRENPEVTQTVEYVEDHFVHERRSKYFAGDFTGYRLVTTSNDLKVVDYNPDIEYIDSIQCVRYDEIKDRQVKIYKIRTNIESKDCDSN